MRSAAGIGALALAACMAAKTAPSMSVASVAASQAIREIRVPPAVVAPAAVAIQKNTVAVTSRDPSFVQLFDVTHMRWSQTAGVPNDSGPFGIASGHHQGEFWVSLFRGGYGTNQHWTGVLRISNGMARLFRLTSSRENPALSGVATDDRYVYATELHGNHIDQLDERTGRFARYAVPTANAGLFDVTLYQGAVWFTEANASALGELLSTGTIRSIMLHPRSRPVAVCTWGSNLVAVTQLPSTAVVTAAGRTVRIISLPTGSVPDACVSTQSALWVTDRGLNAILKIDKTYQVQTIPLPTANAEPERITSNGQVVIFTESRARKIGLIRP